MTLASEWLLIALVVCALWLFFYLLNWTFDRIEKAWATYEGEDSQSDGERGD